MSAHPTTAAMRRVEARSSARYSSSGWPAAATTAGCWPGPWSARFALYLVEMYLATSTSTLESEVDLGGTGQQGRERRGQIAMGGNRMQPQVVTTSTSMMSVHPPSRTGAMASAPLIS